MPESKRPVSAIYAGLDEEKETLKHGGSDASPDVGSASEGAASPSRSPQGSRLKAGQKVAIAIIVLVSVVVIAVSAFALAGGFSSPAQPAASDEVAASSVDNADENGSVDDEGAEEGVEASEEPDGGADAASDGSPDAGASPGSDYAGSPASGGAVESPAASGDSPAPPAESSTIAVAVSVDSSSVGSPVSLVTTVTLQKGASVYDALLATGLSVNARSTQFGTYIASINGLAEKEHGAMSGWTYYVNGVFANKAASEISLSDGDAVSWVYVSGD